MPDWTPNWKCLYFDGRSGQLWTDQVSSKIGTDGHNWTYYLEKYRLGRGVRPPQEGEIMPVFVYDENEIDHVQKMHQIVAEYHQTGQVIVH